MTALSLDARLWLSAGVEGQMASRMFRPNDVEELAGCAGMFRVRLANMFDKTEEIRASFCKAIDKALEANVAALLREIPLSTFGQRFPALVAAAQPAGARSLFDLAALEPKLSHVSRASEAFDLISRLQDSLKRGIRFKPNPKSLSDEERETIRQAIVYGKIKLITASVETEAPRVISEIDALTMKLEPGKRGSVL